MKKRVIIAVLACLALVAAACGSSANSSGSAKETAAAAAAGDYAMSNKAAAEYYEYEADYAAEESMEMPAASPEPSSSSGSGQRAYQGDAKLIYRANVSAQTTDLEKTSAEVEKLTDSVGGYVESSDISNYSNNSYSSKTAYYTIRVPQEKFNTFLETFKDSGICSVTSISKSTTDVGAEYADTEAHLENCRIKQERLQNLLEQAKSMEDIITIESALSDVEYEIEMYSSSLNRYDSLIGFSTITITLEQVNRESKNANEGSLGERIASSFTNGINSFAAGFEDFLIDVAGAFIPLLIIAGIIAVIVIVIVKLVKRGKKKNQLKHEGSKGTSPMKDLNRPEPMKGLETEPKKELDADSKKDSDPEIK